MNKLRVNVTRKRLAMIAPICVVLNFTAGTAAADDGTAIGALAESMKPGEWAELSTINVDVLAAPGAGSSHSIQEYTTGGAWDPDNKVLYFIGSSDPHIADSDGKFVTYSASNNSWEVRPDPPWYPRPGVIQHSYDHHTFDATRGIFYYHPFGVNNRKVHALNVANRTWSQTPDILSPSDWVDCCSGLEYFPERDSLIWNNLEGGGNGNSEILEWPIGSSEWKVLDTSAGMGNHHGFSVYNPVHGVIWMGGGIPAGSSANSCSECTYKLDAGGKITAFQKAPFALAGIDKWTLITADPASGLHLIFTSGAHPSNPNEFWTFDVTNGTWEQQDASGVPIFTTWQTTVVPLSNYGVLMFPKYQSGGSTVWLYKHGQQPGAGPPPGGSGTFNDVCQKGADGFPTNPNIVNCWGFESESEIYYHDRNDDRCKNDDSFLRSHVNGYRNGFPGSNADVNSQTCLYPKIDNTLSASGNGSLKIIQVDDAMGDGNSAGTFHPYIKKYKDANGNWRHDAFGRGGEFWVRWRYRQDAGLFHYGAKRFMVTEHGSSFEQVLAAFATIGGKFPAGPGEPYKYICSYSMKGQYGYGCSSTKVYEANKWHKIEIHVKVPTSDTSTDGIYEVFFDNEKILNSADPAAISKGIEINQPYAVGLDLDTTYANQTNAYFRLDFLLFENSKFQHSPPRPQGSMWVDDIVVSRARITILDDSGTIVPRPPTQLDTQ